MYFEKLEHYFEFDESNESILFTKIVNFRLFCNQLILFDKFNSHIGNCETRTNTKFKNKPSTEI